MYKKVIFSFIFLSLMVESACAQSNLPQCKESWIQGWSNCVGVAYLADGKYIGSFQNGKFEGYGEYIYSNGMPPLKGYWKYDQFIGGSMGTSQTSNAQPQGSPSASENRQGFNIEEAKKKCTDLGFKNATEAFGKCVLKLSQ
jgi:hypothetical protein